MRARWAVVAFGAGALLGATTLPGWLLLSRHRRARRATSSVEQAVASAVATERADPGADLASLAYGIGQGGGMSFGVYEPGPFGVEDYAEHAVRHPDSFPRLWCRYCYGSGCRKCHGIGEVAP